MSGYDTNVRVRFLLRDDESQFDKANIMNEQQPVTHSIEAVVRELQPQQLVREENAALRRRVQALEARLA